MPGTVASADADGSPDGPSPKQLFNLQRPPINEGQFAHRCAYCPSTFAKTEHLKRHERSHTKERPYVCVVCGKKFTRGDSLTRHLRLHENGGVVMGGQAEDEEEDGRVDVEADSNARGKKGKAGGKSPTERQLTVGFVHFASAKLTQIRPQLKRNHGPHGPHKMMALHSILNWQSQATRNDAYLRQPHRGTIPQ
jgi:hypothetical protein